MTMDEILIPYVVLIQSPDGPRVANVGRARVPVGLELQNLGLLIRIQLEALRPEATGCHFRYSWYGSGSWLASLSGRTTRPMRNHMLLVVDEALNYDLDVFYTVAIHGFGDGAESIKRGVPECSVFVIHGHDTNSLQRLAAFLEIKNCIPIILSRMPRHGGETIVEALERVLPSATLVVALFTEDDEGRARSDPGPALRPRTRQNVLVEAGYAIIQRRADSLIIVLGDVEMPSDFAGILTLRAKQWGFQVENQLADFISSRQ